VESGESRDVHIACTLSSVHHPGYRYIPPYIRCILSIFTDNVRKLSEADSNTKGPDVQMLIELLHVLLLFLHFLPEDFESIHKLETPKPD